jgi:hypothetical protein
MTYLVIQLDAMRLVRREEYDTVMLESLPLDFPATAFSLFVLLLIFRLFDSLSLHLRYSLSRVLRHLLIFLCLSLIDDLFDFTIFIIFFHHNFRSLLEHTTITVQLWLLTTLFGGQSFVIL